MVLLGPSPIPPIVILKDLDLALKRRVQETLLTMHHDPQAASELGKGRIKRFAAVSSKDYAVLGEMFDLLGEQAAFHIEEAVVPGVDREYLDGGRWRARPAARVLMPPGGADLVLTNPLVLVAEPGFVVVDSCLGQ